MNILDENISANQAALLASWRIRSKQIGVHVGRSGMADDSIIPLLVRQTSPTFFTRDKGFYDLRRCHARYCLVFLDVRRNDRIFHPPSSSSPGLEFQGKSEWEKSFALLEDRLLYGMSPNSVGRKRFAGSR